MENSVDLSQNWTEEEIAVGQRKLVDEQLEALRKGSGPEHFDTLGRVIKWLRVYSELGKVTLLDAGCASAYYYEIIEHYEPGWVEYAGLDYSQAMLDLAKENTRVSKSDE